MASFARFAVKLKQSPTQYNLLTPFNKTARNAKTAKYYKRISYEDSFKFFASLACFAVKLKNKPLLWAVIICSSASVITLFIISGKNKKTYTAILGTIGGVIIAGLFAFVAGKILRLSGLGNEDAQMLAFVPQYCKIDYQGLLFAGIMIGSLGAVMDVAMSISSSMWEIISVSPKISNKQLVKSGMNIGRDIIGSMSNTLVLAYVSTSIPVLLLFIIFSNGFTEIINLELLSAEILRAVSGSIGLICTIPITVNLVNIFRKN